MDDIMQKLQALKKEKHAVILAHYYAPEQTQAAADFVGDSYALAKRATATDADVIVFCGVRFMGESAKILNPEKTVLMPDPLADCPMANMADGAVIAQMRARYEDLAVVCYINSTAEIKGLSDVCVTSSNAVKIVKSLPNKNIFFTPDENLGRYVARQVPEKNVICNRGFCHVHTSISEEALKKAMALHPGAPVLAHPECREEVLRHADYVGSTAEMIEYAGRSDARAFLICTEPGVGYTLERQNPGKAFFFVEREGCCPDMKRNSLEKVYHALLTGEGEIQVDAQTREKALRPLNRMLELAK